MKDKILVIRETNVSVDQKKKRKKNASTETRNHSEELICGGWGWGNRGDH